MEFLVMVRGDPALKKLFVVVNERSMCIIPVFTDAEKCTRYMQQYFGTTPVVFDLKGLIAVLAAAELIEKQPCWVALNPERDEQHECYQMAEFEQLFSSRIRRKRKKYKL